MFRRKSNIYRSGSKRGHVRVKKKEEEKEVRKNPFRKYIFRGFKACFHEYQSKSKRNRIVGVAVINEKKWVKLLKAGGLGHSTEVVDFCEGFITDHIFKAGEEEHFVVPMFIRRFSDYLEGVVSYMMKQEKGMVKIDKFLTDYSEVHEIIIESYVKSCEVYSGSLDKHQFPLRVLRVKIKEHLDILCGKHVIDLLKTHYCDGDYFAKFFKLREVFSLERIKDAFENPVLTFSTGYNRPYLEAISTLTKMGEMKPVPSKMMWTLSRVIDVVIKSINKELGKDTEITATDLSLILAYVILNVDIQKFPAWLYYIRFGIHKSSNFRSKVEKITILYCDILDWLINEIDIEFDMSYIPKKKKKISMMMDDDDDDEVDDNKMKDLENAMGKGGVGEGEKKVDSEGKKSISMMMDDDDDDDKEKHPPLEEEEEGEGEGEGENQNQQQEKKPEEQQQDEEEKTAQSSSSSSERTEGEIETTSQPQTQPHVPPKKEFEITIRKTFSSPEALTSVLYFQNVKKIVASCEGNMIRIYDIPTEECVKIIRPNKIETEINSIKHMIKFDEESFICCSLSEGEEFNINAYSVIPPEYSQLKEFKNPSPCGVYQLLKLGGDRDQFLMINEKNEMYVMSYSQGRVLKQLSNEKVDENTKLVNSLRLEKGFFMTCSRYDKSRIKLINYEENKVVKSFSRHKKCELFSISVFLNSENEEMLLACGKSYGTHPGGSKKEEICSSYTIFIYNTTYSILKLKNPLIKKLKVDNVSCGFSSFCYGEATLHNQLCGFVGNSDGSIDCYDFTMGYEDKLCRFEDIQDEEISGLVFVDFHNYDKNSYNPILTLACFSAGDNDKTLKMIDIKGVKYHLSDDKKSSRTISEQLEGSDKDLVVPYKNDPEEVYLMKRKIREVDQDIQSTMFKLGEKDKIIQSLKFQIIKIIGMCDEVLVVEE